MKHIIDINTWSRRNNYEFFRNYANSWYSITTEIECGGAWTDCKASGDSFCLHYLHAVLCAANEVEALRYRKSPSGEVVLYDNIDIITPISVGDNFVTVRIPYIDDFKEFQAAARKIIDGITPEDSPYGVEDKIIASGDYDIMHLSAVPKMHFTSLSYTFQAVGTGCLFPLSVMGKACRGGDGKMRMPYSIYIDHAFVDGAHLSAFFEKIESRLR